MLSLRISIIFGSVKAHPLPSLAWQSPSPRHSGPPPLHYPRGPQIFRAASSLRVSGGLRVSESCVLAKDVRGLGPAVKGGAEAAAGPKPGGRGWEGEV